MRTVTVDHDKVEEAQKNRQGRQPGLKEGGSANKLGVPDDGELAPQYYLVKKPSFINGTMVEAGKVVRLPDGVKPGKYLEAVKVVHRKPEIPTAAEAVNDSTAGAALPGATAAKAETTPPAAAGKGQAGKVATEADIPAEPIPAGGGAAKKLAAAADAGKGKHVKEDEDDKNI